jgi:ribosomal protein L35AE/L33A
MPFLTEAREVQKLELAGEVLRTSGAIRLLALGTSMLPAIWPGDILCIERKSAGKIVHGDIVLVARDGRFFVHRAIEKRDGQWITLGDSLPQKDPPVAEAQILGKVSRIHRKAGVVVPKLRRSFFGRAFASLLCRWDWFRNFALRIHSLWIAVGYDMLWAPWRPRPYPRRQHAAATAGKMPALHESR